MSGSDREPLPIVSAVRRQSAWIHFHTLIYLEGAVQRKLHQAVAAAKARLGDPGR